MLDGVVVLVLALLDRCLDDWEALTCQDALVYNTLARHEDQITRQSAVLGDDDEVSWHQLVT